MSQARVAALRLLNRRDYTARELRDKLIEREYPEAEVASVLADLTQDGSINDRRVAESVVRVASSLKGRGRLRIARELEHRGVERELVREVLTNLPADDEAAAIRRFLDRKRIPDKLTAAEHRKVFGQLARRGFSPDLIARTLRAPRRPEE